MCYIHIANGVEDVAMFTGSPVLMRRIPGMQMSVNILWVTPGMCDVLHHLPCFGVSIQINETFS